MLQQMRAMPVYLPELEHYLLDYPKASTNAVKSEFYWEKVNFGLKPTFRIVQAVLFRAASPDKPAYAVAVKQLYASHYFETALDLTFCVPETDDTKPTAFYLIKVLASEQSGLTGPEGSIVRHAAVGRSVSSLQKSLMGIKNTLEPSQYP